MSSEVEAFRQMTDKEVDEMIIELKTLRKNNDIMKKMLATIETITDLLKNKSFRCLCKQSINTKVKTKLSILNKKYVELKHGLESMSTSRSDHKLNNNLIVIKTNPQKRQINDSFAEQCVEVPNLLSETPFVDDINGSDHKSKHNQTFDDLKDSSHESDGSLTKEDEEEEEKEGTVFDEMSEENYEYCCQFSDSKTGILCQKKFTTKQTLLNHVFRHSGQKPWFCEYPDCEYRAVLRSHLIGHIRKSHTARHQFQCDWYSAFHLKYQINAIIV